MTTLVVGASGSTGKLLVKLLLDRGERVRVVVRDKDKFPENVIGHKNLVIMEASILDLSKTELLNQVEHCSAVASCLGHNPTFKGIFGPPRHLVTEATRRLCEAIKSFKPDNSIKFVLMNTTGNRNLDLMEPISFFEKCVLALMRWLLPPQVDNEKAANYLRTEIGQRNGIIQWVAVRPYNLVNLENVSEYSIRQFPTRGAIFDSRVTSRINVAHFMADLITKDIIWSKWEGQMPIIYDNHQPKK